MRFAYLSFQKREESFYKNALLFMRYAYLFFRKREESFYKSFQKSEESFHKNALLPAGLRFLVRSTRAIKNKHSVYKNSKNRLN
jgi:hypothetical protein